MGTVEITPTMQTHLKELRDTRKRYEAVIGEKVIGTGSKQMTPEELDKVELVNAIKAAKQWYESLAMETEVMKELRAEFGRS